MGDYGWERIFVEGREGGWSFGIGDVGLASGSHFFINLYLGQ